MKPFDPNEPGFMFYSTIEITLNNLRPEIWAQQIYAPLVMEARRRWAGPFSIEPREHEEPLLRNMGDYYLCVFKEVK